MSMDQGASEIDVLLKSLRDGRQDALAELFNHYRTQLRRMVELRLDPRLAARVAPSDVLQEAYLDSLARYERFFAREGMSFYVWLRLVVNQRLVDLHRRHLGAQMRNAAQEANATPWAHATSVSLARHLVAQMDSPSQVARKDEMFAQVQSALETLEPLDREILTLRHFEELSNNEVAELLGLAKAAASNRYVRALGRLREALEKVPGFYDGEDAGASSHES